MAITPDDLLNLTVSQRASTVRFDVLDQDLAKVGEVQPDRDSVPSIENNMNRAVKRVISGLRINPLEAADIDQFGGRIRPVWVLQDGSEYPCGVFLYGAIESVEWEWGTDRNVSGVDQCFILDQEVATAVAFGAGTPVKDAIEERFAAALVPQFEIDPGISASVATPIGWPPGTSNLEIINDLAALGGAFSAYFDNNGVGRVRQVEDASTAVPDHVYDSGGRILTGTTVRTDSLLDAPNTWIVIDTSNPDESIVGSYTVDPDLPQSVQNRGFVVSTVITEQGLESVAQAQQRAAAAAASAKTGLEWVAFASAPDPRHDTYDAVQFRGEVYREQGWTLPLLDGSDMTHDLRRSFSLES